MDALQKLPPCELGGLCLHALIEHEDSDKSMATLGFVFAK